MAQIHATKSGRRNRHEGIETPWRGSDGHLAADGDDRHRRNGETKAAKIFVIGGKADDPFWSKVKKGADDAGLVAKATGGSVTWLGPQNYDNLGPDAAKLIRTALSQHPERHRRPGLGARGHGRRLQGSRCRAACRSSSTTPAAWTQPSGSAP